MSILADILRSCSQTTFTRRGRYVGDPKFPLFVNVHTIENVNEGGVGGQKSQNLVNVVCEQPLEKNHLQIMNNSPSKFP